jgi:hypothetical protein
MRTTAAALAALPLTLTVALAEPVGEYVVNVLRGGCNE